MKINTRPNWLQRFNPDLTIGLLAIILVLALLTAFSIINIVAGLFAQQPALALYSAFATAMYGISAYGLFRLKRWARFLQLFLSILSFLSGIVTMFSQSMGTGILTVIIHGLIAIYLLTDDCRRSFGFTV